MSLTVVKALERVTSNPITLMLVAAWVVVVAVEYKFMSDPYKTLKTTYNSTASTDFITKLEKYNKYAPSILAAAVVVLTVPTVPVILTCLAYEGFVIAHSEKIVFHIIAGALLFIYFALNKDSHRLLLLAFAVVVLYNVPSA